MSLKNIFEVMLYTNTSCQPPATIGDNCFIDGKNVYKSTSIETKMARTIYERFHFDWS